MGSSGGFTVWQGTALNCRGNEITLVHRQFTSDEGAFGECNDGSIVGRSIKVENGYYTSQLRVRVNSDVIGESIVCLHDHTRTTQIGHLTINATTGCHQLKLLFSISYSLVCNNYRTT